MYEILHNQEQGAISGKTGRDYYLEITSSMKEMKERSMNQKFKERFEDMLNSARDALSKPRGKKNYEKVLLRIGRATAKYPSIAKHYEFTYSRSEENKNNMADFTWKIKDPEQIYIQKTSDEFSTSEVKWVI